VPPPPAIAPAQALPLETLIQALTPPAVPSLSHARSLASVLASHTPIPSPASLNPVLASLCASEGPLSIQAAGYDILSAYWENNEAIVLGAADRVTYFSLFLGPSISWSHELWEPRFRALRALTKYGTEVVGIECAFLNVLESWIQGAFEGLLVVDTSFDQPAQRIEREKCFEVLTAFLTAVVENPGFMARIPDGEVSGVLQFYAGLVDRAIVIPSSSQMRGQSLPSSPLDPTPPNVSTSPRPTHSHRRNPSSLSISSLPQANPPPPPAPPPSKHPADLAVTAYLNHLTSVIKTTSPDNLDTILPLLFRSLAFHATPLPRLSITSHIQEVTNLEHRISETLDNLLSGPFATTCIRVLKTQLFPPVQSNGHLQKLIQTSVGAQRTLRNYIRKSLCIRLARAYISREASVHYSPSGAPGYIDMERDLMERAWPKDDVSMWDSSKLGRVLCKSVEAWVVFNLDTGANGYSAGREKILEEIAGTLKDILQEIDSRDESIIDDEEAGAVGETLRRLASYLLPLKYVISIQSCSMAADFSLVCKNPGW
jgi:tuberous sclerosis 2